MNTFVWVHTWWGRGNTDLPYSKSLQSSDIDNYSVIRHPKRMHRVDHYMSTLKSICGDKKWDYMLRIEDDSIVSKNVMHNLRHWDALKRTDFGIGFLSRCDRVIEHCGLHDVSAHTMTCKSHGYHFGPAWIASCRAVERNLGRIESIMWAVEKLGRFGPTTAVADAMIDSKLGVYVHVPSMASVDVSIPSHQLGDVSKRYGNQYFDNEFIAK
jgi:hypothetical protein